MHVRNVGLQAATRDDFGRQMVDLHWNSPVPSTMINMPYPEAVFCVPSGRSHGTFHE